MEFKVKMLENENWWGGSNNDGIRMPFNKDTDFKGSFLKSASGEAMPLYISDKGRAIWSEKPFSFEIKEGEFSLSGEGEFFLEEFGSSLKDAFRGARAKYFPSDKRKLNRDFFKTAQYNTWIECLYDQNQEHIMKYAEAIIENGFEPGILMIDEGWHGRYGIWDFDRTKFPDPKGMVDKLHEMGFKVLLWVVPWVCPDGEFFFTALRESNARHENDAENRLFIRQKQDPYFPALYHWWNGFSALLNLANEEDRKFLDDQLQFLMKEYGIDGFKFDGGSVGAYSNCITGETNTDLTPHELNFYWNKFASEYDYHEYKDTYCGAQFNTIQRLSDRSHQWEDSIGFSSILPCSIAQGLIGHPFICPDMVGGGSWEDFKPGKPIDGELFVRWAQASALFPMMQYSKAPWDALSEERCRLVLEAGKLHKAFTDEIIEMVERAEESGEPILRNLEYNYPNQGFATINDEFMLEDKYLVAPVLQKGARERRVILPEGEWQADDGKIYMEGEHLIECPLDRLIYFKKI